MDLSCVDSYAKFFLSFVLWSNENGNKSFGIKLVINFSPWYSIHQNTMSFTCPCLTFHLLMPCPISISFFTSLWLSQPLLLHLSPPLPHFPFPTEFDIWTQFVTSDYMRALELDALNNSHPIEVPVGHPSEVDEIFDAISYSKVCSFGFRSSTSSMCMAIRL